MREGSEEYLHSEKYEIKQRALDGPLLPLIERLNRIRRENPALQQLSNVTFLDTANEALIAYAKQSPGNTVITVVNIDPHQPQEGLAIVPGAASACRRASPSTTCSPTSASSGGSDRNYVRLEPGVRQAHVLRVEADMSR